MLLLITNPQFRLLWLSFTMAGVGVLMYMMVNGWLTLSITNSPFWVGAVAGAGGVGFMAFSIPGGVLADRVSRQKLIVGSGLAYAAASGLLAIPVFSDDVRLWHVMLAALSTGVAGGLSTPAYMAMTLDLVGRGRLLKANAAISVGLGIAGIGAPLMGGAVVSAWHIGWAYVIIAGAELLAVAAVLRLSRRPMPGVGVASQRDTQSRRESPWEALKVGVRYVFGTPAVRTLILIAVVMEAFGWAHISMLPVMARDVLGVGVTGLGYLQSASFAGFLLGNLVVSSLPDIRQKGRLLIFGVVGFSLFLMLFAASRSFPLSLGLLAVAYGIGAGYDVGLGTLVQSIVPDEMRGRVVSFQSLTWGVNGVSGFHTGAIAALLGAPAAIAIGAGVILAYALRLVPLASRLEGAQPDEG
jgi:MFS family permease